MTTTSAAVLAIFAVSACESSMHEPPPIESLAPTAPTARSPDESMQVADAAWQRRGEVGEAALAQDAYLGAAAVGEHRVDALLGAMRAIHYRVEYEVGVAKAALTDEAVQLGQWCVRIAPHDAACDYRLAIALGQVAREHPMRAKDAVEHMIDLLHGAIAIDPALDDGGPHRVLAFVLVRAPSWPGPGDAEGGLDEARAAVATAPELAENQLALAEALEANGSTSDAHDAYRRAESLAAAEHDPEAAHWLADARGGLAKTE